MIYPDYVDQYGLVDAIHNAGHTIHKVDDDFIVDDIDAVRAIVNSYDPLPVAQKDAIKLVMDAAAIKRYTYTNGKDLEYMIKQEEVNDFVNHRRVGNYMMERANVTGERPRRIADIWTHEVEDITHAGSKISALEDKALLDIRREKNWQQCLVIAQNAVEAIEAINSGNS